MASVRFDDAMTEMDADVDRGALVPGSHRLIRAVGSAEGPFSGALVGHDDGVAVCIDVADLVDWRGWAHSGDEHVCGVLDVRRRADGHDALLPWCTQQVEKFLGRRRGADEPLSAGELGTLVVSLLRGIRELGDSASDNCGQWWLTGDGRPLFVIGDGGSARAHTAGLIGRIGDHTSDRPTMRVLEEIASALRERRHHVDDDARWEQALLTIAAPRALRLDVFAPERVADLASRRSARATPDAASRVRMRRSVERAEPDSFWAALRAAPAAVVARVVALRDRSERARGERVRRERGPDGRTRAAAAKAGSARGAPRRSHRRPLILAGSLVAVILAVGLLWPQGDDADPAEAAQLTIPASETHDQETVGDAGAVEDPGEKPVETPAPAETTPPAEDGLSAVPALLDVIAECTEAAAPDCPAALVDGLVAPDSGLATRGAQASVATLVDDYGDVAVIKLVSADDDSGESSTAQMLVLERREEKWLVRDVYDVAHQPD